MWHKMIDFGVPFFGTHQEFADVINKKFPESIRKEISILDDMDFAQDKVYKTIDGTYYQKIRVVFPTGCAHKGFKIRGRIQTLGGKPSDDRDFFSVNDSGHNSVKVMLQKLPSGGTEWYSVSQVVKMFGWKEGKITYQTDITVESIIKPKEAIRINPEATVNRIKLEVESAVKRHETESEEIRKQRFAPLREDLEKKPPEKKPPEKTGKGK